MDYARLKPLKGRAVVKVDPKIETSDGGISLIDFYQDRPNTGIVLSVGEDARVAVGDRVFLSKFGGVEAEPGILIVDTRMDEGHVVIGVLGEGDLIQPLAPYSIVRLVPRSDMTDSKFYLPEFSKTASTWGLVVAGDLLGAKVYVTPTQGFHWVQKGAEFVAVDSRKICAKFILKCSSSSEET